MGTARRRFAAAGARRVFRNSVPPLKDLLATVLGLVGGPLALRASVLHTASSTNILDCTKIDWQNWAY